MNAKILKKYLPIGALVLAVVAGIIWWAMPNKVSAEDRYVLAQVDRGPITQTVSANGTLNPVVLVSVGSQVSGIVKKLYADFNDHVKAGQVLLELDPSLLQAQLKQSEANVASAEASLQLAQANEARLAAGCSCPVSNGSPKAKNPGEFPTQCKPNYQRSLSCRSMRSSFTKDMMTSEAAR